MNLQIASSIHTYIPFASPTQFDLKPRTGTATNIGIPKCKQEILFYSYQILECKNNHFGVLVVSTLSIHVQTLLWGSKFGKKLGQKTNFQK